MGKLKFGSQNQMVCNILFGKVQKIWALILGNAIFFGLLNLFGTFGYTLFYVYAQDFHQGGLRKWLSPQVTWPLKVVEKRHRVPSCYINVNRIINAIKDCFLFFLDLIQKVFLHYVFDKIFVNRCSAQVSDWSYANCFNNKVSKGSILSRFASV